MKSPRRGNVLVAVLIFLALTSLTAGGLYFWQTRPNLPITPPLPISTPPQTAAPPPEKTSSFSLDPSTEETNRWRDSQTAIMRFQIKLFT